MEKIRQDKDFLNNRIIQEDIEELYHRKLNWESMRGKTIWITGAYGMLASYLVYMCIFLNEIHGYNITIIVAIRNYEKLKKRFGEYVERGYFKTYLDDINKPIDFGERVHYIVHGASLASSQYYGTMPIEVILPNVLGTVELLKLAERSGTEAFLLFSSGEIYGKINDACKIVKEDCVGAVDTLNIRNCYCESKRMAEMLCYSWYVQKKVPIKIARIFHTYGPTMDTKNDQRVFASFVNDIIEGHNIVMRSNGMARRPFCYIADATAAYFKILLEGKSGEAYNVCNADEFITIKELAETLVGLYPEKQLVVEIKEQDVCKMTMENTMIGDAEFSNEKLKKLGWDCKYNVREGFLRTIKGILGREG